MYFIKALNKKNEWWKYLIVIIAVVFAQSVASAPILVIALYKQLSGAADLYSFMKTYDFTFLGIDQNIGLILLLVPSLVSFFVLLYMMKVLHGEKIGEIFSSMGKIRWNRLVYGAGLWLVLLIAGEITAAMLNPGNYEFSFDALHFFPLVIVSIAIIPFQAGFEELLFRSYLMRGIGLLFRSRIIALILTSLGFGLLHIMNPEVGEFGLGVSMIYYIGFGLFAGLLVIFDDGIEMAIGVHAINNIYGAVLVSYNASVLKTSALWKIKELDPSLMNILFFALAACFLIIMAIKYNWSDWRKIFRIIPQLNEDGKG